MKHSRLLRALGSRGLVVALLFVAVGAWAQAKGPLEVEGYTYDDRLEVAGQSLVLNGVGLRAVAWLKGYSAGLYLRERTRRADVVLADGGAKRVRLRVLLDVSSEEFVKGFDNGVEKNSTPEQLAVLKERMLQFDAVMRAIGNIKKGDVFDLDYLPGAGLQLLMNRKPRGAPVAGADFYAALMRIFIGQRPVDKELKDGMLGGPVR